MIETKIQKSKVIYEDCGHGVASVDAVYKSWCNTQFLFKEDRETANGLREPQLGAIHAILGYLMSDLRNAATIVMPTGTGKTDVMISAVIAGRFEKTLVIVPSDALREQVAREFAKLELQRNLELITSTTLNPRVAIVKHGIKENDELDQILNANVIIATPQVLSKFSDNCFSSLTHNCSHLIIDEAHHIAAKTWANVKRNFIYKPVLQFTATPFRNDGSKIEGQIIFNYSLKRAQSAGYFKKIQFFPVKEFNPKESDQAVAKKAIELLRQDISQGFNHILMVRVSKISRLAEVFKCYERETDLHPIAVHSKLPQGERELILQNIKNGKHKIIACVDMLGEGFNLPELKIAAIHDPQKSLSIVLQFTGRFTRTSLGLGEAKFVANIANPDIDEMIANLYREDSDWNVLISQISTEKISREMEYQEFINKFSKVKDYSQLNFRPILSTLVYKLSPKNWLPEKILEIEPEIGSHTSCIISDDKNILITIAARTKPVDWANSKELEQELWCLYIAYFCPEKQLLFIHSSEKKDPYLGKIVDRIALKAEPFRGNNIFRAMGRMKRIMLQNIGLNNNKKNHQFTMHTGRDLSDSTLTIDSKRGAKSNVFCHGYENGQHVSLGCSIRGKVWSMADDNINQWLKWCDSIGEKLLDTTIDPDTVLKTAMKSEELFEYPANLKPWAVDWPKELINANDAKVTIETGMTQYNFCDCELRISKMDNKTTDMRLFAQKCIGDKLHETCLAVIRGSITAQNVFKFECSKQITLCIGSHKYDLTSYLNKYPPCIFLSDTSFIDGATRYYLESGEAFTIEEERLNPWDWTGVDLSVESQTIEKKTNSIQFSAIQRIKDDYDVVFDDDGAGEIADIVAIKEMPNDTLKVDFYHCNLNSHFM